MTKLEKVRIALPSAFLAVLMVSCSDLTPAPRRMVQSPTSSSWMQLRWENIEDAPLWVSGVPPSYSLTHDCHVLKLEPAGSSVIKLPPGSILCLRVTEGELRPSDLEVSFSQGSGLYVEADLVAWNEPGTLVFQPRSPRTLLVRVARPPGASGILEIALLTTRTDFRTPGALYHRSLPLPARQVTLSSDLPSAGGTYYELEKGETYSLDVSGPAQLALESRLVYPATESGRLQSYHVEAHLDRERLTFLLETSVDGSHRYRVDSEGIVVGEVRNAHLELPPGPHTLEFTSSARLYAKLLRSSRDDFLIHEAPANPPPPQFFRPLPADPGRALTTKKARWRSTPGTAEREVEDPQRDPFAPRFDTSATGIFLTALTALMRDNTYEDVALLGAMQCHDITVDLASRPADRAAARSMYQRHSRYRDLLPHTKRTAAPQLVACFLSRRLLDPLRPVLPRTLDQHPAQISVTASKAVFLQPPRDRGESHCYRLPPRSSPSLLRIIVERSLETRGGELMIQFDDEPPRRLEVGSEDELPVEHYEPTRVELAIARRARLEEHQHAACSSGIFEAPCLPGGVAEVPLPADVNEVRVWASPGGERAPYVALQYRVSRYYRMTEMEFREFLRRARERSAGSNPLLEAFHRWERGEVSRHLAERSLANHWLPLFRYLEAARSRFRSDLVPPRAESTTAIGSESMSPSEIQSEIQEARRLEKAGYWLAALETWDGVLQKADAATRRQALLSKVTALQALGEHFLAEVQLRGLFLYGRDERLRKQAIARLLDLYSSGGSSASLETVDLLAVAALEFHSPDRIEALVQKLADNGLHHFALVAALSLPEDEQPLSLVLRCALQEEWWQTFAEALERLPAGSDRQVWTGLRLAKERQYQRALRAFEAAGKKGQAWAESLRRALALRRSLTNENRQMRFQAILDWEEWHAQRPGPQSWHGDPSLIVDFAGTEECYNPARRLSVGYHSATPARPVRLKVSGPAAIKIEARPLHDAETSGPIDGWLLIRRGGLVQPVAITGNLPSRNLRLTTDPRRAPGRRLETHLTLGPGLHEITVGSPTLDVLVRTSIRRPEIDLGLLPPLSVSWMREILRGAAGSSPSPLYAGAVLFVSGEGAVAELPVSKHLPRDFASTPRLPPGLDPVLGARLALRLGARELLEQNWVGLRVLANDEAQASRSDRMLALAHLRELSRDADPSEEQESAPPTSGGETDKVALHDLDFMLSREGESSEGPDSDRVRRRMNLLLYVAETNPSRQAEMRVLGEALFAANRQYRGTQALHSRLTRPGRWERVLSFEDSGGVKFVDVPTWHAESPALKVRLHLVPPLGEGERLLSGAGCLGISLVHPAPTTLRVDVSLERPEYLPLESAILLYQLDGKRPIKLQLSPRLSRKSFELAIPQGHHAVRLWLEDPVANSFLRVRARELDRNRGADPRASVFPTKRRYDVATLERPLRLVVKGPAWLRIDEFRDNHVLTDYRHITGGWQQLVLTPQPGQPEALFRVFRRVADRASRATHPPRAAPPVPTFPPALNIELPPKDTDLRLLDSFTLGGQEDGTFSILAAFRRQRVFDESGDDDEARHFFELEAVYRELHEQLATFSETAVLGRVHGEGGPTVGFREILHHRPTWLPVSLRLSATAFVQWPEGSSVSPSGSAEWSGTLRGGVLKQWPLSFRAFHVTGLSIFGRYLSLDEAPLDSEKLDQDVFTSYKNDHRAGLALSETVVYRPWLDTEWWARASLGSNEDFNPVDPDKVAALVGWKQFYHGWQLDLSYRATHFFEDDDRSRSRTRHAITFQLLKDLWWNPRSRLELGFRVRQDFPDDVTSGFVFVAWHFSNGRHYRDFRPGEVDFLPLRHAEIPSELPSWVGQRRHQRARRLR